MQWRIVFILLSTVRHYGYSVKRNITQVVGEGKYLCRFHMQHK
nr:MAG TPA: hypothetical protein [Caudoviricetes sp.]